MADFESIQSLLEEVHGAGESGPVVEPTIDDFELSQAEIDALLSGKAFEDGFEFSPANEEVEQAESGPAFDSVQALLDQIHETGDPSPAVDRNDNSLPDGFRRTTDFNKIIEGCPECGERTDIGDDHAAGCSVERVEEEFIDQMANSMRDIARRARRSEPDPKTVKIIELRERLCKAIATLQRLALESEESSRALARALGVDEGHELRDLVGMACVMLKEGGE